MTIDASLDGAVRFEATIARPQSDLELRVGVRSAAPVTGSSQAPAQKPGAGASEITSATARFSGPRAALGVVVADPRAVDTALAEPVRRDVGTTAWFDRARPVQSYFGFRTVGVEDGRVTLNHHPIYLKLVLDQGYWPDSLLTPPTDDAIQRDIGLAKDMGFNGARKHQKIEDPRYLYWADSLGFLVSDEIPNAYLFTEQYVPRFTREWAEAVERDSNHPSIVMWAPLNESWGVPDLRDARQQAHLGASTASPTLDPSRPVIDNEGWEHTEATDLFAVHDYARRYEKLERCKSFARERCHPHQSPRIPRVAPGHPYNGLPLYLRIRWHRVHPARSPGAGDAWGYSGVEKTPAPLERLAGQSPSRECPFTGMCYTQITDVEQEINGLLTNDRKPKFDTKAVKEINDLLR